MTSKPQYGGLDWLKFAAALLVIANHTSPLSTYNGTADFLLSGILTRIAVPIFFMTAGFFFFRKLTGDPLRDNKVLSGYLRKVGALYGAAILLYIPLNLYTGYFSDGFTVGSLLKDLVFNGTFYHLWYLPALMIGITLTAFLYRKTPTWMLPVSITLYVIGLLGDSYYGFIKGVPWLSASYGAMFHLFDYTRNGLFFAPVYLALGAAAAKGQGRGTSPVLHASLFAVSLGAMFAEGLLLRSAGIPRHDSMYVFALPAAYCLFRWALSWKGTSNKRYREWRTWLYILHPLAIVLVRGAAKAVHWEAWLVRNSLLHFAAVCIVSIAMSAGSVYLWKTVFRGRDRRLTGRSPASRSQIS
ncbi:MULTISPECIES: acyltransferase family protein [Paenibacillus]|uniref:Acyltransferase 3 domain-containing protein n=1 Tax=Paenibacillus albilobatus TaxID=2716884 RepID=A0A919XFH8_9BACL|nr:MULTISPECIES: acyltransferase family protein [Paenibacillus]GIO30458.1 hypothetical protein J2TS6_15990 [Paenibacillus albilobatus]